MSTSTSTPEPLAPFPLTVMDQRYPVVVAVRLPVRDGLMKTRMAFIARDLSTGHEGEFIVTAGYAGPDGEFALGGSQYGLSLSRAFIALAARVTQEEEDF